MRTLLFMSAASLLALSAPAFAQYAGDPGAVGVAGPLTGASPGPGWSYGGGYGYGYPGYGYGYGRRPGVTYYDVPVYGPGVIEGRGAYEDYGYDSDDW